LPPEESGRPLRYKELTPVGTLQMKGVCASESRHVVGGQRCEFALERISNFVTLPWIEAVEDEFVDV
jgi:hypothetical protein